MKKTSFLIGFAAGYTLGAKAGRDRYDQIVAKANEIMGNPKVQQATQQVTDTVREKAPEAAEAMKAKLPGSGSSTTSTRGSGAGSSGTADGSAFTTPGPGAGNGALADLSASTTDDAGSGHATARAGSTTGGGGGEEIPTPADVASIVEHREAGQGATDGPRQV